MFHEAQSIDDLINPAFLSGILGTVLAIEKIPIVTVGFSEASHVRLRIGLENGRMQSLIVKYIHPGIEMKSWRIGGNGDREILLLKERDLDKVWNIFQSPFFAYAEERDTIALLMYDLSEHLFPDIREPLKREDEETLLSAFAKLHSTFWENPLLRAIPWLADDRLMFGFLPPNVVAEESANGRSNKLYKHVDAGWNEVRNRVSNGMWTFLNEPITKLHSITSGLPKTLLHGDSKVANFAIDRDSGKVNAFDWSMIASGEPALEIGWYVAVNATRLTRSKEDIFRFYRVKLEENLGVVFPEHEWRRMEASGILAGAMALLWSKGLNLSKGLPGSDVEWNWWVAKLERIKSEYLS